MAHTILSTSFNLHLKHKWICIVQWLEYLNLLNKWSYLILGFFLFGYWVVSRSHALLPHFMSWRDIFWLYSLDCGIFFICSICKFLNELASCAVSVLWTVLMIDFCDKLYWVWSISTFSLLNERFTQQTTHFLIIFLLIILESLLLTWDL
mgnify:FL=1